MTAEDPALARSGEAVHHGEPPGLSARSFIALGFVGVAMLVVGLFGWGVLASVSSAAIAQGRITVEARHQPVSHVDGGVVEAVLVRNGDEVSPGDVLVEFAVGALQSEVEALETQLASHQARRERLEAELRNSGEIEWSVHLLIAAEQSPAVEALLRNEELVFDERLELHREQSSLLDERIAQATDELNALTSSSDADPVTVAGARSRLDDLRAEVLSREAERLDTADALITAELAEEQNLAARIRQLAQRVARRSLRSPVAGTVFAMTVAGPGDLVRPAAPLLSIVPADSELIVLARIETNLVDQIYIGQESLVRFPAFAYQSTPERAGRVLSVSADAYRDEQTGTSWFDVELAIDTDGPDSADAPTELPLVPGMPAEVIINTGERSILSYLAKPVTDFFTRSLREN